MKTISSFDYYLLNSGEHLKSPRWQCEENSLTAARGLLNATRSKREIIPVFSIGSEVLHLVERRGKDFATAVALGEKTDSPGLIPLATWITAWNEQSSDRAWDALYTSKDLILDSLGVDSFILSMLIGGCAAPVVKPKSTPWCAVYAFPPCLDLFPSLAPVLSGFECILTWAQLESAGFDITPKLDRN